MVATLLWMLFIAALAVIILVWIAQRSQPLQVQPVTNFAVNRQISLSNHRYTTTSGSDKMEQYRASWNPSPSPFVEKHELRGSIAGAADAVIVPDIPASAFEVFFDVEEGAVCNVYLRTYGDNATTADSPHVAFTAKNEQQVAAVEDFGVAWVSHKA